MAPHLCCSIVLGLLWQLGLAVELVAAHVQLHPVVAQHLLLTPHPHAGQYKQSSPPPYSLKIEI